MKEYLDPRKIICQGLVFAFLLNTFGPVPLAQGQSLPLDGRGQVGVFLPAPGVMVPLSPTFNPPILKGLKVHPDNPFRFDFILDKGDSFNSLPQRPNCFEFVTLSSCRRGLEGDLKIESTKLIKYFLASLTIPEKDLWVNLSPYEKNRIIPQSFGLTEMGRDLLAEDYMLKQITASLIYPEGEIGKRFWKRIYEEAAKKFGTTNIPVNTFNKVWIVPEKAVVFENAKVGTAYVVESKLKVMLEQDYLSLKKHEGIQSKGVQTKNTNQLGSQVVREIIIPELTKEVNENKNFSQLRQVYNSLILATWYKKKIKSSILEQVYVDKNKTTGVNINDPQEKEKIYERYLQAFKKGVYNYIKEEIDPASREKMPRKYFSGGVGLRWGVDGAMLIQDQIPDASLISSDKDKLIEETVNVFSTDVVISSVGTDMEHSAYNNLVTGNGEVFNAIAQETGADQLPRIHWADVDGAHKDFDFRGAIMDLQAKGDPRVRTNGDVLIVSLLKDKRYLIMRGLVDPLTRQRDLIFIDDRFGADHAGRRRNQTYARDLPLAFHEYTELLFWKTLERCLQNYPHWLIRRSFIENGVKNSVLQEDKLEHVYLLLQKPLANGDQLKELMKIFKISSSSLMWGNFRKGWSKAVELHKRGLMDQHYLNVNQWIRENMRTASALDTYIHTYAKNQEMLSAELVSRLGVEGFLDHDRLLAEYAPLTNVDPEKTIFAGISGDLTLSVTHAASFKTMISVFDEAKMGETVRLAARPSVDELMALRDRTNKKPDPYEVVIVQLPTGETYAVKGDEGKAELGVALGTSRLQGWRFHYHNHPVLINRNDPIDPPSYKDFGSLLLIDLPLAAAVGDARYVYVYSTRKFDFRKMDNHARFEEQMKDFEEGLQARLLRQRNLKNGLDEQGAEIFYREWKEYLESLGLSLERYTWEYAKEHEEEMFALLNDPAYQDMQPPQDVIMKSQARVGDGAMMSQADKSPVDLAEETGQIFDDTQDIQTKIAIAKAGLKSQDLPAFETRKTAFTAFLDRQVSIEEDEYSRTPGPLLAAFAILENEFEMTGNEESMKIQEKGGGQNPPFQKHLFQQKTVERALKVLRYYNQSADNPKGVMTKELEIWLAAHPQCAELWAAIQTATKHVVQFYFYGSLKEPIAASKTRKIYPYLPQIYRLVLQNHNRLIKNYYIDQWVANGLFTIENSPFIRNLKELAKPEGEDVTQGNVIAAAAIREDRKTELLDGNDRLEVQKVLLSASKSKHEKTRVMALLELINNSGAIGSGSEPGVTSRAMDREVYVDNQNGISVQDIKFSNEGVEAIFEFRKGNKEGLRRHMKISAREGSIEAELKKEKNPRKEVDFKIIDLDKGKDFEVGSIKFEFDLFQMSFVGTYPN